MRFTNSRRSLTKTSECALPVIVGVAGRTRDRGPYRAVAFAPSDGHGRSSAPKRTAHDVIDRRLEAGGARRLRTPRFNQ